VRGYTHTPTDTDENPTEEGSTNAPPHKEIHQKNFFTGQGTASARLFGACAKRKHFKSLGGGFPLGGLVENTEPRRADLLKSQKSVKRREHYNGVVEGKNIIR